MRKPQQVRTGQGRHRRTACTVALVVVAVLSGCATAPATEDVAPAPGPPPAATPTQSADDLYRSGKAALSQQDFAAASRQFSALEAFYPDHPYSYQAQMELAYGYYKAGDQKAAIATAERFIRNYPDHKNLDYLYYLRGLASFDAALLALDQATGREPKPESATLSLGYFNELIQRFPHSAYSKDAANRIVHLNNRLALYELRVAKAYLADGDYRNAAIYAKAVFDNYPQSSAAAEAVTLANMAGHMVRRGGGEATTAPAAATVDAGVTASTPTVSPAAADTAATVATAATAPAAVARGLASGNAADGIRDEAWIMAQAPDHYTIQILGSVDLEALVASARRYGVQDRCAWFRTLRDGVQWFNLIYGVYPGLSDAQAAMAGLPEALRRRTPWVRNISDVQAAIEVAAAAAPQKP